ncbi:hypothetical protein [Flavobacterium psychrotolerans]|uniref:hypothetical protein n=1 Tax=Flavobacterium psychrotolerans TaxID=2169410 RepID=UPI001057FDB6|nr:hypothetical protein [Flavobacterium psychrotolerans]
MALALTLIVGITSCSKDDNSTKNENNNGGGSSVTTINLQNSTYTGTAFVTFTDGSTATGNFQSGTMKLPLQGDKIIAGIQPENEDYILLGRKQGETINLNYHNRQLQFRIPINGVIPIGSYAEFQLINTALNNSYKLETNLDFMNLEWTPIGTIGTALNFDGQNHEISNLKISTATIFFTNQCTYTDANGSHTYSNRSYLTGLFASVGSLKNLIIRSGSITAISTYGHNSMTGAFVGWGGYIENCKNYANVNGDEPPHDNFGCSNAYSDYTGGIMGRESSVKNCINYGNITNGCGITTISNEAVRTVSGNNGGTNGNINYGTTSGCP